VLAQNRNSVSVHCTSCQSALVQPPPRKHSWTPAYSSKTFPSTDQLPRLPSQPTHHTQQLVLACLFTPIALGTNTARHGLTYT